jgi:hypothetical protein
MKFALNDIETSLAARHGLTGYEKEVAAMILAGRAACPLRCYPARVVSFVAEIREQAERQQRRDESPLTSNSTVKPTNERTDNELHRQNEP